MSCHQDWQNIHTTLYIITYVGASLSAFPVKSLHYWERVAHKKRQDGEFRQERQGKSGSILVRKVGGDSRQST